MAARPSSKCNSRAVRCFSKVCRSTCLVNLSEVFSAPGILTKEKSPALSRSCVHRSAVARCLILPRPRRRHTPMAAMASVCTFRFHENPRSCAMEIKPREMPVPLQIPMSSYSPDDNVTVLWVTDQCFSRCLPRRATPPEVDRRAARHHAKSVSTDVVSC